MLSVIETAFTHYCIEPVWKFTLLKDLGSLPPNISGRHGLTSTSDEHSKERASMDCNEADWHLLTRSTRKK
jgi:hypothetical protein